MMMPTPRSPGSNGAPVRIAPYETVDLPEEKKKKEAKKEEKKERKEEKKEAAEAVSSPVPPAEHEKEVSINKELYTFPRKIIPVTTDCV